MENQDYNKDDALLPVALEFINKISTALKTVRDWYSRNAETIAAYLAVFSEFGVWMSAVNKLSENQLMFTDDLTFSFARKIYDSENVKQTVEDYYTDGDFNHFNLLVERCRQSKCLCDYQRFFNQIMSAYEREHFQLACTGLFSLIDRVLADNTDNAKVVNFNLRIKAIMDKLNDKVGLDEVDRKAFCIYTLMDTEKGSIFDRSDFRKEEPVIINRNWLLHGRTQRNENFFDFLLVLLWLDAIILMIDLGKKGN